MECENQRSAKVYSESSETSNLAVSNYLAENLIQIYPNPAKEVVNFSRKNIQNVSIFNAAGQKLNLDFQVGKPMQISHLEKGIYVLNIIQNKKTITKKLIVK